MRCLHAVLMVMAVLFMLACSDSNENETGNDNVWKEQTATMEKAREVEAVLRKSAEDRAKAIEEQTR